MLSFIHNSLFIIHNSYNLWQKNAISAAAAQLKALAVPIPILKQPAG